MRASEKGHYRRWMKVALFTTEARKSPIRKESCNTATRTTVDTTMFHPIGWASPCRATLATIVARDAAKSAGTLNRSPSTIPDKATATMAYATTSVLQSARSRGERTFQPHRRNSRYILVSGMPTVGQARDFQLSTEPLVKISA